jgi:hypothetical protein
MRIEVLRRLPAPRRGMPRLLSCLAAAGAAVAATCAVASPPAMATFHDYCNYDGTSVTLPASTLCKRAGTDSLTSNYAYLVSAPSGTTIFCGAELDGSTYGSYNSGSSDCSHSYAGTHDLVATLYTSQGATAHGSITY